MVTTYEYCGQSTVQFQLVDGPADFCYVDYVCKRYLKVVKDTNRRSSDTMYLLVSYHELTLQNQTVRESSVRDANNILSRLDTICIIIWLSAPTGFRTFGHPMGKYMVNKHLMFLLCVFFFATLHSLHSLIRI